MRFLRFVFLYFYKFAFKTFLNWPQWTKVCLDHWCIVWCQESLFLCEFGIDFAFYNLARCLAWPGSWLNIFGLKTGSLGWRKDTNRIYIFTTRQSGVGRVGRASWSDIYNYPARQSIHSSQTFLRHLFSGVSHASSIKAYCIFREFLCIPRICSPSPP